MISAEEFARSKENWGKSAYDLMRDFAKLHVIAALKEAAENAWLVDGCDTHGVEIDEDTIINAYPLTNIK